MHGKAWANHCFNSWLHVEKVALFSFHKLTTKRSNYKAIYFWHSIFVSTSLKNDLVLRNQDIKMISDRLLDLMVSYT